MWIEIDEHSKVCRLMYKYYYHKPVMLCLINWKDLDTFGITIIRRNH